MILILLFSHLSLGLLSGPCPSRFFLYNNSSYRLPTVGLDKDYENQIIWDMSHVRHHATLRSWRVWITIIFSKDSDTLGLMRKATLYNQPWVKNVWRMNVDYMYVVAHKCFQMIRFSNNITWKKIFYFALTGDLKIKAVAQWRLFIKRLTTEWLTYVIETHLNTNSSTEWRVIQLQTKQNSLRLFVGLFMFCSNNMTLKLTD